MKDMERYMLILIGSHTGIEDELKYLSDKRGTNFITGKGMFFATFYSPLSIDALYMELGHRPAIMLFNISNNSNYAVNLPTKYFQGLFPEEKDIKDMLESFVTDLDKEEVNIKPKKKKTTKPKKEINIDFVLDKLAKNDYDKKCLTDEEMRIMEDWGSNN